MNKRQIGVLRLALNIFGSQSRARAWLSRPFEVFDGKNALQMLETDQGCAIVEDLLNRLRYAFLAEP